MLCTLWPHHSITWQPGCPGAWPHWVNSYWYIADTPSPAILGLLSCKRLAVVKMNCTTTVMQPGTKPPSPAPASTTATIAKPATVHAADKSIRSTDDLIKEFPDWFTGIGRFPGKYKIWLQHDVYPVIHAPRKCSIALCLKVKEHLNKMECLGVITHGDEPTDWLSSITYIQKANGKLCLCLNPHNLNEASAKIITRCPLWRKSLMNLHTLTTSPSWMPTMDTGQSSLTSSPACLWHSTVPSEDTISCDFPLALSVPKTSSRRRWTRS